MNIKKKKFIKIGTIINIFLILIIFSLVKIGQLDRGTTKNEDLIITPKTSSITISNIEFSQAHGDTFDIRSRLYFKTGDGPFTIILYLEDQLDGNDEFQGEITSIDPYYHVRLYIDVEMIPNGLQIISN